MSEKEKNTNQSSGLLSSGMLRLLGILLISLVVIVVLANVTANDTLRVDTAEDVPGDVEDIASEIIDIVEAVQEGANTAAAEISDVTAVDEELTTVLTENVDATLFQSVNRVGVYQPDGESYLVDITDPEAVGDAVGEAIEGTSDEVAQLADLSGEATWIVLEDGVRYVTPIESAENAYLWMDVSSETLTEALRVGAEGEASFSETETGYALLAAADGTVLAEFNRPTAAAEQVNNVLGDLTEERLSDNEEYYTLDSDPLVEETTFVASVTDENTDWVVLGAIPASDAPTQSIVDSTLNLFDVSEVGDTVSLWVERAVSFLNEDVGWLFRGLRVPIEIVINTFEDVLIAVPWFIVILATGAVAMLTGGRQVALISVIGMFLIGLLGLWELTMTTLAMLLTSMAFCVVVGIPVGIWAASNDRVNEIVRSVLDAMQTIHPFVYLVPIVVLFGIGKVPGTIATIIFALPPMVRLTNLGIRQVPEDVVEASKAFGSSDWQLLRDVQIPLALPSIMAGVNQTLMLSLSMVVIVALIAGGGLGQEIYRAIGRADTGRAVVAGVAVLLLAVVIDRISQGRSGQQRAEE
jgi:glycine betaine/proline transport system permease protein